MKNENIPGRIDRLISQEAIFNYDSTTLSPNTIRKNRHHARIARIIQQAEILFITSYPPRECGIATYSQDLISALNKKFNKSLSIKICALENGKSNYDYPEEVKYTLGTSRTSDYLDLIEKVNNDNQIQLVLIQHEFGFYNDQKQSFLQLMYELIKPIVVVFHTVLPNPDERLRLEVKNIVAASKSIIVMTKTSADILMNDYGISKQKIKVIAH
ncbi:MAG: mannosyltransferase, partial [Paludibacter sp.]